MLTLRSAACACRRYLKAPFAWLSICELSTIFLNARWFLAVTECKSGMVYTAVSFAFALTFLATRAIGYSLGIANLWLERRHWLNEPWGLTAVIIGLHAGLALNWFWSVGVVKALVRAAGVGAGKKKKE